MKQNKNETRTPALKESPVIPWPKKPDSGSACKEGVRFMLPGTIRKYVMLPSIIAQIMVVDFHTPLENLCKTTVQNVRIRKKVRFARGEAFVPAPTIRFRMVGDRVKAISKRTTATTLVVKSLCR